MTPRSAEIRLAVVRPTTPGDGDRKVVFGYDQQGRRVRKRVLAWQAGSPGEWVLTDVRKFVWSGWLMLLELEGSVGVPPASESIVRKYTWGLDLAGLSGQNEPGAQATGHAGLPPRRTGSAAALQGAGGIGGLLAMQAPGAGPGAGDLDAVYTYDANGNVGQLIAWPTGYGGAQSDEWHLDRLLAHYEYDPYGGVTAQSGTYAAANPVRFSTKYWDDETGLGYWGYRYYSPSLGRWISRDPIEKAGGPNIYVYGFNAPVMTMDSVGQMALVYGGARQGGCCGPDITQRLFQVLARFQQEFYRSTPLRQARTCRGAISPDGWDIAELKDSGSAGGYTPFQSGGCGTGRCAGTVQVNGQCYRAAEVNYALWGKLFSLCSSTIGNWTRLVWRKTGPGEWDWVRVDLDGFRVPGDYGLDEAVRWAYAWGAVRPIFQRNPPNTVGPGSTECRAAWTRVGWNSDVAQAAGCTVPGCSDGCCQTVYNGEFNAFAGIYPDWVTADVP